MKIMSTLGHTMRLLKEWIRSFCVDLERSPWCITKQKKARDIKVCLTRPSFFILKLTCKHTHNGSCTKSSLERNINIRSFFTTVSAEEMNEGRWLSLWVMELTLFIINTRCLLLPQISEQLFSAWLLRVSSTQRLGF